MNRRQQDSGEQTHRCEINLHDFHPGIHVVVLKRYPVTQNSRIVQKPVEVTVLIQDYVIELLL